MGAMESSLCSELHDDCFNGKGMVKSQVVDAKQKGRANHPRQTLPHPRVTDAVLNKANQDEAQKRQQQKLRKVLGGDPLGSTCTVPYCGKEGIAAVYPPKGQRSVTPWQQGVAVQGMSVQKSSAQKDESVGTANSSRARVASTVQPVIGQRGVSSTVTVEADLVRIPSHQTPVLSATQSSSCPAADRENQPPPSGEEDHGWSVQEATSVAPRAPGPEEEEGVLGGGATLHGWINDGKSPQDKLQLGNAPPYPRSRKLNEKRYAKTMGASQVPPGTRPTFDDAASKQPFADRTTNAPVTAVGPSRPSREAPRLTTPYSAVNTPPRGVARPGGKFVTQVVSSPAPPTRGVARDHPTVLEVKRHSPDLLMTR
mmetsp:Transcript_13173/g.30609  ORF Transcript_13173/g.30609 Transcript_13173/m.30609 type:complete len:369 (+) Transcript_13173:171-1277(+)